MGVHSSAADSAANELLPPCKIIDASALIEIKNNLIFSLCFISTPDFSTRLES
jgi:hypothetical protein